MLHIISSLEPGGAETMLVRLVAAMDRSRFQQTVVSLGSRGSLAANLESSGANVHALNLSANPLKMLGGIRKMRRLTREFSPHWIQGWMVHGNLMGRLVRGSSPQAKLAWNIRHTLDLSHERLRTRALVRLSGRFVGGVDVFVSNSTAGAADHERIGYPRARRRVIPNGFDLERFRPDGDARRRWREAHRVPQHALLIGSAARYHPMKHQAQLVRAVAGLPETHVAFAGRGIADNPQLLALAEDLGVADRMHLIEHQRSIEEFHQALDVYCLCSQATEGFPTAVGEAMACGVPAVVTDVGDAARIVGDTGKVVPLRDIEALVAALSEVIDRVKQDREAVGDACRMRIRDNFALAKITAEYEALYASAGGAD